MGVIEEFIARYKKEVDFYDQAGRIAAQLLDSKLREQGIRAIVTSRANTLSSLDPKLKARIDKKGYKGIEDIYSDMADLAGVRIALYFPEEASQVQAMLPSLFSIVETREFPDKNAKPAYAKRFSGYRAFHFRVRILEKILSEQQRRYSDAKIEVQVASVLMHAWSEVEHDLVYKPLQGKLSEAEYDILDELNGLVMAGEIALKRLQVAGQLRLEKADDFSNHYELASFILTNVTVDMPKSIDRGMGRADILFAFLKELGLAKSENVKPLLRDLHSDLEHRAIAEQVVDRLLSQDPARYSAYQRIAASFPDTISFDDAVAVGFKRYIEQWVRFEALAAIWVSPGKRNGVTSTVKALAETGVIDNSDQEMLLSLWRLRNSIVHGTAPFDPGILANSTTWLYGFNERLSEKAKPGR